MHYSKTILPNGLRIITVPMKENPTVTVMVMVEAGSKYENPEIAGISHFLEHMCFKGTTGRPSALAISKELDTIGASYNASTGRESTVFYAKSDKQHIDQIFDVVSDIYLNSTFPEKELQKEKGVVIEEIRMYKDDPTSYVQELFNELLYGNQPTGWDIAGTEKSVASLTQAQVIEYHRTHYVPEATVIAIAGGFDEEKVLEQVEKIFGALPRANKAKKAPVYDVQDRPVSKIYYKETDQTHLVLGFRGIPRYDERMYAMGILHRILGRGMSSRLFQKLREEMAVCYYVGSGHNSYTDHGLFGISCGVEKARTGEVIKVLLEECARLCNELVTEEELSRAKSCSIGKMYLGLESSDSYADFYGVQELFSEPIETPESEEKKVRAVTREDIQNLAKEIIQEKNLNLAVVGPHKQGDFDSLLRIA